MSFEIILAVRPEEFKIEKPLASLRAGLPWTEKIIWPSAAALLWQQVTDEKAMHEEKTATRVLQQVMPLCREDTAYYEENDPVVKELAKLIYERNFKVLPFRQRLDVVLELRRFAAEAGEKYTAILGGNNCEELHKLMESGVLLPEHFLRDLREGDDYIALFDETMLARKGSDPLLMRREDMAWWQQRGGVFTMGEAALPTWPEKTPEELLSLREKALPALAELGKACRVLAKAKAEELPALWEETLQPQLRVLSEGYEPSDHRMTPAILDCPGFGRRPVFLLEGSDGECK